MKTNWRNKSIRALLLTLVLLLSVTAAIGSVSAVLYEDAPCSVTVHLPSTVENLDPQDVVADFYYIGSIEASDGTLAAQPAHSDYDELDWTQFNEAGDADDIDDFTQAAAKIILTSGEPTRPNVSAQLGEKQSLGTGVYLIAIRPIDHFGSYVETTDDEGNEVINTIAHGTNKTDYYFSPTVATVIDEKMSGNSATADLDIPVKTRRSHWGDITIKKVDEITREVLTGAVFTLYSGFEGSHEDFIVAHDERGQEHALYRCGDDTYVTGEDGTVKLYDLEAGVLYALVETDAPDGYVVLDEPIYFYIKESSGEQFYVIKQLTRCTDVQIDRENLSYHAEATDGTTNGTLHYTVTNESDQARYIRVKAFSSSRYFDVDGYRSDSSAWKNGNDGYWYYEGTLAPGATTPELLVAFSNSSFYPMPEGAYTVSPEYDFCFMYESSTEPFEKASDENSDGARTPILLTEDVLVVENSIGVELPETGGRGTVAFYAVGGTLMILAAAMACAAVCRKKAHNG